MRAAVSIWTRDTRGVGQEHALDTTVSNKLQALQLVTQMVEHLPVSLAVSKIEVNLS